MKSWFRILMLFCLIGTTLVAKDNQDLLKMKDITQIMKQILDHHVDKKELSSKVFQNALTTYIDQFDSNHMYLLESEVIPYTRMPDQELNQVISQYKQGDFSVFKNINRTIQNAIYRSREIRQKIEIDPNTFRKPISKLDEEARIEPFAKSLTELQDRLRRQYLLFIDAYRRRYGENVLEQKSAQQQIQKTYEIHLRQHEDAYLFQDDKGQPLPAAEQENLFTIHILKALASSLDAHTAFYEASEAYDMRVRLQKEFCGIGLILQETPEGAVVSNMLPDGPAAKSGAIQVGDLLNEIDGKSVANESFDQVMEKLHGERHSIIELGFKRKGANGQPDQTYRVKLQREEIILNNDRVDTSYENFGNGIIGRITLHSFYQGDGVTSEKDVRNAIQKLESKGHLRGLILDLRDNNGGFLSQAVKVAGLFITNGVIVISKYANGEEKIYRDVDGKVAYDGPLVVLTSRATASAAEIVAQALQDYGVALIAGDEHTYGKGTIQSQTVTDDKSTSYFKVTVGKYYTVSGKTPQKQGVKADIVVPGHRNREPIGEEFLESPVEPDTIQPEFDDNLSDVTPDVKSWYLKYYTPSLQHPKTVWRHLLPALRKNSQYRIERNKNYQFYLKGNAPSEEEGDDDWMSFDKKNRNYGEDDLQLQEAVNIVKDMIMLHSIGRQPAEAGAGTNP